MGLNAKQQRVFDCICAGKNVFVTGPAGSGKTYLIDYIKKWYNLQGKRLAITATTGIAACLIKGLTFHSWAGIGLGEKPIEDLYAKIKKSMKHWKRWRTVNALLVDEISMFEGSLFEKIDQLFRIIRKKKDLPFGGVQLILVGDFCQLPPVTNIQINRFCFESKIWDEAIHEMVALDEVIRQSDTDFVECLNKMRFGKFDSKCKDLISNRIKTTKKIYQEGGEIIINGIKPTHLYPLKRSVYAENLRELKKLTTEHHFFDLTMKLVMKNNRGELDDDKIPSHTLETTVRDQIEKYTQVKPKLELAVGAQVMLIYNKSFDEYLINGSRGIITRFDDSGNPVVRFVNGKEYSIEKHSWEYETDKYKATYSQVPLQLAWACSQHKSQGMTLDLVETDLGKNIFEYGQIYTTMSRVRTLDGLFLRKFDSHRLKCHPAVKKFYQKIQDSESNQE